MKISGKKSEEVERLREEVAQLQHEREELVKELTRVTAETQERTYWLDRWHIDLNRVMATTFVSGFFNFLRAVRRSLGTIKRALKQAIS